jgi:hypothetical protein
LETIPLQQVQARDMSPLELSEVLAVEVEVVALLLDRLG